MTVGKSGTSNSYGIPSESRRGVPNAKWIKPGEQATVQGVSFDCGMVYMGSCLPMAYGHNDPSLINPDLLATKQPVPVDGLGYWPSYERIGPTARYKYLEWLATGRSSHNIDIGYVFLFFYGLERRVLIDALKDNEAHEDLKEITKEIERLLKIHGPRSFSFQRYASGLLDVILSASAGDKAYQMPIPTFPDTYELPHYLKIALGQASRDKAPVPADLALAWAEGHPGIYFRTAAQRCEYEFNQLFRIRYAEKYGEGMILPQNRTRLKCLYEPASSGFRGHAEVYIPNGDLPDVTAVSGPIDALGSFINEVTDELDSYSRLLGRAPEIRETPEARLLLPIALWPKDLVQVFDDLRRDVETTPLVIRVSALMESLDLGMNSDRKVMLRLAKHLSSKGIGIEPDFQGGARTPKVDEHLVLFRLPIDHDSIQDQRYYRVIQLTLQLAVMVAMADGDFSVQEQNLIEQQIASWDGLKDADRIRLQAHLKLVTVHPMSLGSLKKRIEQLSSEERERVAGYMVSVASADGIVSPAEVRLLEKAYKALGIEVDKVFRDLHSHTHLEPRSVHQSAEKGLELDYERVNRLQRESEDVSDLLAEILSDKTDDEPVREDVPHQEEAPSTILGLDNHLAKLVHLLLSRPVWSREELVDASLDMDLMLDGALERINDASFELYDQPLFEGEDPLEVNQSIIDSLKHE
ncbi:MAG TPA: TerB N-terminal domain-containing protein [Flavobacteriales bacterium]|nr:TerB N-terminal domain-containing protein [Flavobacteriales bacterium]